MTKEQILKTSREENQNKDLVEEATYAKATLVGTIVGWCVIGLALLLNGIFLHQPAYDVLFIWFSIESGIFVTKYVKLRKTHELIVSIIYILAAVATFVLFLLNLMGVL